MSRIMDVCIAGRGDDGACSSSDDTATLKAHILTLQGRIEALERTVTAMKEREIRVRRAVGQFASAYDLTK